MSVKVAWFLLLLAVMITISQSKHQDKRACVYRWGPEYCRWMEQARTGRRCRYWRGRKLCDFPTPEAPESDEEDTKDTVLTTPTPTTTTTTTTMKPPKTPDDYNDNGYYNNNYNDMPYNHAYDYTESDEENTKDTVHTTSTMKPPKIPDYYNYNGYYYNKYNDMPYYYRHAYDYNNY